MQIKIFTVPIDAPDEANAELNRFLSNHRVVDVQQALVADRSWTFCVRYVLGEARETTGAKAWSSAAKKTDYKEVLSEDEFARFSKLRTARKTLAGDDGIPAFAVFTDAELAAMSREKQLTLTAMKKIEGVGKARVEHYGAKILALIASDVLENETIQSLDAADN